MRTGNSSTSFRQRPEKISQTLSPSLSSQNLKFVAQLMSRNLPPRNFNYRPDISPPEICRPELFSLSPRNHCPELYSYRPEIIAQNRTVIAQKLSPRIVQLSPRYLSPTIVQLSPRNLSPRNVQFIAQKFITQIQCIAQKLLFNF